MKSVRPVAAVCALVLGVATLAAQQQQPPPSGTEGQSPQFKFRSAVELINVTATVTDASGRFVPGLRQEDFRVFEDGAGAAASRTSAASACR